MSSRLEKYNARKPIIENGIAIPTSKFEDGKWLYGILIWGPETKDYTMYIDEAQMLTIVQEWFRVLGGKQGQK